MTSEQHIAVLPYFIDSQSVADRRIRQVLVLVGLCHVIKRDRYGGLTFIS